MIKNKEKILSEVKDIIQNKKYVSSARIYGSWLYNEKSVDMDIAIIVQSEFNVISPKYYRLLRDLRISLCDKTKQDIDLVPHTEDELTDHNSPLWYPRYNPSLVFGYDLKGNFHVVPVSIFNNSFSFADLAAYVLHDNRTICRRQLIRSFNGEEGRIFVSKLLHGPGNALTYLACKQKMNYNVPPSNLNRCFELFDEIYGVDSSSAIDFLFAYKQSINFEQGILFMNWYENLMNVVFYGEEFKKNYQYTCDLFSKF